MMGGSKMYGLPTKSQLDRWEQGGDKYKSTDELTIDNVYSAMKRVIMGNPNYTEANPKSMAKAVERELEKSGFTDIRASEATVSDGDDKYKLERKKGNVWVATKV